jgi:type I restriction enzyme S subunit
MNPNLKLREDAHAGDSRRTHAHSASGFDLLATAPDGVRRLRELILSLAVRGKLVRQSAEDESAKTLLRKISAEKAVLLSKAASKKERPLPPITPDMIPFGVPASWIWTRLGDLAKKVTDGTHHSPPNHRQGDFRYISAKNIKPWGIDLSDVTYVTKEIHDEIYSRCNPELGDVLYIKDGATTGVVAVNTLDEPFSMLSSVGLIKPSCGITAHYLATVMASPFFYQAMRANMTGVAITRVTIGKLNTALIPLPPLKEQTRIVERVTELMKACDSLERNGQRESQQHARLTSVLLDSLVTCDSPTTLAETWRRVVQNFALLLDRPEAVDVLERTILRLAVRGFLVEQRVGEEPAIDLVKHAKSEKERLGANGKRNRGRGERGRLEQVAVLPKGWTEVGFLDLCAVEGGATPSKARVNYWSGDMPWVSPKDMKVDVMRDSEDHVSELALRETRLPVVTEGSVLVVVRGMILAHSSPVAIAERKVTLNQDMKGFTPYIKGISEFLALVCKGFDREILSLVERSSHGTCKLESEKLFGFRFGLPPLAEQRRIIARVNQLRLLCALLRTHLRSMSKAQTELSQTLVASARAVE